jgi:nucleoside-diphosphate-sugar epimerase
LPSKTLQADTEQVTGDARLPWGRLQGASVLVTGATGLIGSNLVRTLRAASDRRGLNLCILGTGRNREKLSRLTAECGADFAIGADIRRPLPRGVLPEKVDFIFHCASMTRSADMAARPVDVITTAIDGTKNVLETARKRNCRGFVYLSSMEVYGQARLAEVRETVPGRLDVSKPRSAYPESKRLCESLSIAYAAQYGVPVKIARPAQTFGAGTPRDDTRVFAQFARSAASGEDLVLHTDGKSRGNYCYTADAVSGLLYILLNGRDREAYNIANPAASATIREMAETVAGAVCGGKIGVTVKAPKTPGECGYAPDIGYRLNADKLTSLGWQPRYGLREMYVRLLSDWRNE